MEVPAVLISANIIKNYFSLGEKPGRSGAIACDIWRVMKRPCQMAEK